STLAATSTTGSVRGPAPIAHDDATRPRAYETLVRARSVAGQLLRVLPVERWQPRVGPRFTAALTAVLHLRHRADASERWRAGNRRSDRVPARHSRFGTKRS